MARIACTVPSDGREGRDRESIDLAQEQLVKQVFAVNPKTVVVLVSSFPFAINWSEEHAPAILHMAHSSQDEGTALAEVLFGDYNPGGHYGSTWPKSLDQLPPMMDYNIRDGRTYMYFKGEPLYPFGYGLSYTTFKYSNLRTSSRTPGERRLADRKRGCDQYRQPRRRRRGRDVREHLGAKVQEPHEALKGFKRVTVAAGETKTVEIPLKADTLAWWDEKLPGWKLEAEPVKVLIGDSSANILLNTTIHVQ